MNTDSYISIEAARDYFAALPGLAAMAALDDAPLAALLLAAANDIDAAMRYQGRKAASSQIREFPRVAYGRPVNQWPSDFAFARDSDAVVYDWDADTNTAIVPESVKLATLYQAAWLQQPANAARLEAIRSGLASQSIGSASESYAKPAELAELGQTGLSDRAARIMERYRLKTGRLL